MHITQEQTQHTELVPTPKVRNRAACMSHRLEASSFSSSSRVISRRDTLFFLLNSGLPKEEFSLPGEKDGI